MISRSFRFQNVELIGAYVCATDLSSIINSRSSSSSSSSNNKVGSKGVVGIITSVTENCYFITTISLTSNKNLDETQESFNDNNVVLQVKQRLKKNTVLAVAIPDDGFTATSNSDASKSASTSLSKDTSIIRRGICNYINGADNLSEGSEKGAKSFVVTGIGEGIVNFQNVVMVYGK